MSNKYKILNNYMIKNDHTLSIHNFNLKYIIKINKFLTKFKKLMIKIVIIKKESN